MRWAVLLRAVNLGARNQVPMRAWAARLEALGHTDVRTYLQSGQAVLTSEEADPDRLCAQVRSDLLQSTGLDVRVMARDHDQLAAVVRACPWPEAAEADPTKVHAVFVDGPVGPGWWELDPDRYAPERALAGPGVVYLLMPGGAGRSRLPPGDRATRERSTARNWRTALVLEEWTRPG